MKGSCVKKIQFSASAPASYIPPKSSLLSFHPIEVARQLCLMEFEVYAKIKPMECVNQAWTKPNKEVNASNIYQIIRNSNKVPMMVGTIILSGEDAQMRAKFIVAFLKIAQVRFFAVVICI